MNKIHVAVVCLLLGMMSFIIIPDTEVAEPTRGIADATLTGKVVNGTLGMSVVIKTSKDIIGSGQPPTDLYFNTTTDANGIFISTVDSNDTSDPQVYQLSPYQVEVRSTYYLGLRNSIFNFQNVTEPGETSIVPLGALEAFPEPLGNLTIRIQNRSSGEPLEGSVVTVDHVPDMPDIPFSQVGVTDSSGETTFTGIRSVETSVDATKLNFQSLSSTVTENIVVIGEGGDTLVVFNLTEDPWPFITNPSNGALSGNTTQGVLIDFGQEMGFSSMNRSSNYLFEEVGGEEIPFTIAIPRSENDRARLVPDEPLDYDTDYHISIYATIRSFGGGVPLWRTMDVSFHTELEPSMVRGRIVESGPIPAMGVVVNLVDQMIVTGPDGAFMFPLVIPGIHDLVVDEGYVYHGIEVDDIEILRGEVIDLGDVEITSRSRGSLNVTVTSGGIPLSGAWVKVLSNDLGNDQYNLTTDDSGVASFDMVRSGVVNLKAGGPHHSQKIDVANVPENGLGEITIELVEDPFPVTVEITEAVSADVASATSDFRITPPEEIDFQTLNVTLWILDASGARDEEIDLMQPQYDSGTGSYLIKVQGQIPLGSEFQLVIGDEMEASDDGEKILWRDMIFPFTTPPIPDVNIIGTLLLEGESLEGVSLEFLGQTWMTEADGTFNVSITLTSTTQSGKLVVNMTDVGYELYSMDVDAESGTILDIGNIILLPMADWYSLSPASGQEDVDPGTVIVLTFKEEVMDQGNWTDRIRVIRQNTSAPVTGTYILGDSNKTVTFDPDADLIENRMYTVRITDDLLQKNGKAMFPIGNTTTFKVRPERIDVATGDLTSQVDIDGEITLSFGVYVDKDMVESALVLDPVVTRIAFSWISGSEVRISPLMAAGTDYTLYLEPGRYGLQDQVLNAPFSVSFTTGSNYSVDHSFSSLNVIPEPEVGWETGQTITISGTAGSSEGYQITVILGDLTETTTVTDNGTWTLELVLPESEFKGTMTVSIGTPNGPSAYSREFQVDVRSTEHGDVDEPADEGNELYIIIGVIGFLILVIIIVVMYMISKKRNLDDSEVEITDVDADWSDDEE